MKLTQIVMVMAFILILTVQVLGVRIFATYGGGERVLGITAENIHPTPCLYYVWGDDTDNGWGNDC